MTDSDNLRTTVSPEVVGSLPLETTMVANNGVECTRAKISTSTLGDTRDRMRSPADHRPAPTTIGLFSPNIVVVDVPPLYHEIPGTVPAYHGRSSGPPPSYEEVINPEVPPPSYNSLFGQVREARKTSNGLIDLLRQLFLILISTLGCTIIIGFMVLVPITMIVIGALYMDECRAENIPTFLLIGGLVWVTKNILNCYLQCKQESNYEFDRDNRPRTSRYESLLNCFLFGWFIAGCVLVYRVYEPDYDNPASSRYCNRTVYLYAFWLVSSTFIILGLFLGCMCCLMISSVIASHQEDDSA